MRRVARQRRRETTPRASSDGRARSQKRLVMHTHTVFQPPHVYAAHPLRALHCKVLLRRAPGTAEASRVDAPAANGVRRRLSEEGPACDATKSAIGGDAGS